MEDIISCYHTIEPYNTDLKSVMFLTENDFVFSEMVDLAEEQVIDFNEYIILYNKLINENKQVKKDLLTLIKKLKNAVEDIDL